MFVIKGDSFHVTSRSSTHSGQTQRRRALNLGGRDFTHVISRIVDCWIEAGAWWADEPSHHLFTVRTTTGFLYDIECVGGVVHLSGVGLMNALFCGRLFR
jgi:hypothetical protein